MTTKVTSEFLHQAIISDHTEVSAANADHILIHDASDNTLKKALVSTITGSGTTINNNADNRIITGSGSSGTLEAEGDLTYSGGSNAVGNLEKGTSHLRIKTASSIFLHHSGTTAGNQVQFYKGSDSIPHFTIGCQSGSDDTELVTRSSGDMVFKVVESGGSTYTALTLDGDGQGDVIFGGDIKKTSGDITIDVPGSINLDADNNGEVSFRDGGTEIGKIFSSSSDFAFEAGVQDKDILFRGNDGGTGITALTLDMSDAGAAIFNNSLRVGQSTVGNLLVDNNGNTVEIKAGRDGTHNVDLSIFTQKSDGTLTEYIRVQGDGKVGIGTVAPDTDGYGYAEDLVIKAGASASDGAGLSINSSSRQYGVISFLDSAGAAGEIFYDHTSNSLYFKTNAISSWSLDASGNMIAKGNVTAYGTPSDIRLKENIEVIDNALDKVKQLKGITYDLKSDGNRLTGLIAQDLEKVLPEAVYTSETLADERKGEESEEHLAIRYGNTVGLLVEAIKELSAKIEKLEGK